MDEIELYPSAALGYRVWRWLDDGLYGATVPEDYRWERVSRASCQRIAPCMSSPAVDCGCGLYGYHRLERALSLAPIIAAVTGPVEVIVGAIAVHGRVEIHEQGLRAHEAQILGLLRPDGSAPGELARLELLYGVRSFARPEELERYANRYAVSAV